jgi:hypothetical protein
MANVGPSRRLYGAATAWRGHTSGRLRHGGYQGERMGNDRKQSDDEMRLEAKPAPVSTSPKDDDVVLPTEAQGLIGHQLRQEYRRLLSEPLPDKFTKLLDDLAHSERNPERKE